MLKEYLEFAGRHPWLFLAAGVILALIIAEELRRRVRGVREIEPPEAIRLINQGALVVDIRDTEAYRNGHIIEARNIPVDQLEEKIDSLERYRDKAIVLCCDSGTTSARATAILKRHGFSLAVPLKGGISAWKRDNLPVARKQ